MSRIQYPDWTNTPEIYLKRKDGNGYNYAGTLEIMSGTGLFQRTDTGQYLPWTPPAKRPFPVIFIQDNCLISDEEGYSHAKPAEIEAGVGLFISEYIGEYHPWKIGEQESWTYPEPLYYMPETTCKIYRRMCDEWALKCRVHVNSMEKIVVREVQKMATEEAAEIAKENRFAASIATAVTLKMEIFIADLVGAGVINGK